MSRACLPTDSSEDSSEPFQKAGLGLACLPALLFLSSSPDTDGLLFHQGQSHLFSRLSFADLARQLQLMLIHLRRTTACSRLPHEMRQLTGSPCDGCRSGQNEARRTNLPDETDSNGREVGWGRWLSNVFFWSALLPRVWLCKSHPPCVMSNSDGSSRRQRPFAVNHRPSLLHRLPPHLPIRT